MRGHGAGALGRAPGLEKDDRLEGRGFAERRGERAPVGHALEVGDDHPRFGVFGDRAQEFGLVEIGLVAEAREEGKPHVSVARPVEDRHRERAGVGHERDGARLGHTRREGEVEPRRRTDPAEAVRAQNPERSAAKPRAELGLAPPALVVRFAEAGRDDDGTPDPLAAHSLRAGSTDGAGTAITARSTGSLTSSSERAAGSPWTVSPRLFTGTTRPP